MPLLDELFSSAPKFLTTGNGRVLSDASGDPVESIVGLQEFGATATEDRWVAKANAFVAGWQDVFPGDHPSAWCVSLGLAVAQHETYCGDAWPGEHNWGGVQLGGLNAAETECLTTAGIVPVPTNVPAARAALAAANLTRPGGALHVDSSPASGTQRYYFAWFAAFATDEAGAAYFIKVLAKNRQGCNGVLRAAVGSWRSDSAALAAAMYATGYYEGFHDPRTPAGKAANIADYAGAILNLAPGIYANIASQGWTTSPGKPQFDVTCVMGQQSALTYLSTRLHIKALDPIGVDGVIGPNTKAAISAFQSENGIAVTGIMDQTTQDKLINVLSTLP
jgi:peptidoglycan hydrolase-like protein with peptidoglycan-binding domain